MKVMRRFLPPRWQRRSSTIGQQDEADMDRACLRTGVIWFQMRQPGADSLGGAVDTERFLSYLLLCGATKLGESLG
jgi:hypothetical protein